MFNNVRIIHSSSLCSNFLYQNPFKTFSSILTDKIRDKKTDKRIAKLTFFQEVKASKIRDFLKKEMKRERNEKDKKEKGKWKKTSQFLWTIYSKFRDNS